MFLDMDIMLGVDLIFFDIMWLEECKVQIDGIFIIYVYEDYVGVLGYLWECLGVLVYVWNFMVNIVCCKLDDYGLILEIVIVVEFYLVMCDVGLFKVGFVLISYLIFESVGLLIEIFDGCVLYMGDFKVDWIFVVGDLFDDDMLLLIGVMGIKVFVCDSINIFSLISGWFEVGLVDLIIKLMFEVIGMVVVIIFVFNIVCLKILVEVVKVVGWLVCLFGCVMCWMVEVGIEIGVLSDFLVVVSFEDVQDILWVNLLLLVMGSQGECCVVLVQLVNGKYMGLILVEGDMFLFLFKVILGNECGVICIMN